VPGYEILDELGRGGMGVVYKARQVGLGRLVALKMILAGGHAGADDLSRFHLEAQAIARLQHPNIVAVHEVGEHDGKPFFSLEFCTGGSLDRKLAGSPLPPAEAAQLTALLSRAMHAAHQAHIIHRDLKPANVLLTEDGTPKITDFGLAKKLDDLGRTQTGAVMGTPSYMAPEQAEGRKDIGPPADIYALGAILYELLTGRPPFRAATTYDTILQVVSDDPVPPRQLNAKVPLDVETICLKCLFKDPKRRYASANDLADDLGRWQRKEPILARPTGTLERAVKWVRRRPAVASLVAVSVLAGVGMIGLSVRHNLDLNYQLAQERDKVRRAEQRESDRKRLEALRADGETLLNRGRAAAARKDWTAARTSLTEAIRKTEPDSALVELTDQAREQLTLAEAGEKAREQVRQFHDLSERTLAYHMPQFTGRDRAADLRDLRSTARSALAVFDLDPVSERGPTFDARFIDPIERSRLVESCYQLLLLLASAEATPEPGQKADEKGARTALAILDRAAHLGLTTCAYHLRRAQILNPLDPQAADRENRRAAEVRPAGAADYFLMGDLAYTQGNFSSAAEHYGSALRHQHDHQPAQYFQAICYLRMTGRNEAETLAHRRAAVAGLTLCIGRNPDFVWSYLLRGYAHGELGERERAEEDFARALKMALGSTAEYGLFVNRGVMRLNAGRTVEAITDFQQAITREPSWFQAHVNLARAYEKAGQAGEALTELNRAIALAGSRADLYRARAALHEQQKQPRQARGDLERAAERETLPAARAADLTESARLLRAEGRAGEALARCERALELAPGLVPALVLSAELLIDLHRLDEAEKRLDAALAKDGTARCRRLRGVVRARTNRFADALDDFTHALNLERTVKPDATLLAQRGWVYVATDAPQLALRDFDRALVLDPKLGTALTGRGFVRVLAGDLKPGLDDAEKALLDLQGDPGSAEGPRICYNAARIYAQAAARASAADRRVCTERAVQLLEKAIELLPAARRASFWQTTVRSDGALGAVQGSEAYRRLARLYGSKQT
jgi:tetratricopeptide (TPR) repeat protein